MISIDRDILIGKKVLLQYSGGKDSTACAILFKKNNIDFEAIHFVHSYSYELPTKIAVEFCKSQNIKITVIDITDKLEKVFISGFNLRPCRYCKSIIDSITLEYAQKHGIDIICVGDNGDDSMLINRLKRNSSFGIFSDYLNESIPTLSGTTIYRPLINYKSEDILSFTKEFFPSFSRINDTGDKYFEYSREGCPLQYKDIGVTFTKKLMTDLKNANKLCAQFATSKSIKASIHLPSGFIVTIPSGYEGECMEYLHKNGFVLQQKVQSHIKKYVYLMIIPTYPEITSMDVIRVSVERIIERLQFTEVNIVIATEKILSIYASALYGNAQLSRDNKWLNIYMCADEKVEVKKIHNIILEVFHTKKYSVFENYVQL